MEAKFTPGPWIGFSDRSNGGLQVVIMPAKRDGEIATVTGGNADANGHLLIAAPELYYELQQARHDVSILLAMLLGSLEANAAPDDPDDLAILSEIATGYETPSAALAKANPS